MQTLKSRSSLNCTVATAIAVGLFGALIAGNSDADQESNSELLKRVQTLEQRVAELERKQASAVIPAQYAPATVPKSWVPQSINGITYYMVPLSSNETGKATK